MPTRKLTEEEIMFFYKPLVYTWALFPIVGASCLWIYVWLNPPDIVTYGINGDVDELEAVHPKEAGAFERGRETPQMRSARMAEIEAREEAEVRRTGNAKSLVERIF